ncbi:MAG: ABC transporter substrate-binding protein, partial [Pseudomonadota bacterium]
GFYREAKYYYWPGFHEPGAQLGVGINLDLWQGLSAQEQAIIRAACHQANHLSVAEYGHFNGIALDQLINEHGVDLRQFPDDVMAAAAREAKTVLEEVAASDDISARIFDSYKAALRRSQIWSGISDEPYMAIRRDVFSL